MAAATGHTAPAGETGEWRHWRVEVDAQGIWWLWLDRAGESTNSLGAEVIDELDGLLEAAQRSKAAGLAILSAKDSGFIAGADIRDFDDFNAPEDVSALIRRGHAVFAKLENLRCPTVAAIRGFCLGGGLELALCCDWRIAQDVPETRIGLPEVKIGIFPGLGGSVRLTERLGGLKALELILTGRALSARAARGVNMVDEVVSAHQTLRWAARRAILKKRKSRDPSLLGRLSNAAPLRPLVASIMRKQARKKANPEHYPAPYRFLDAWQQQRGDRTAFFEAEAYGVGHLMVGDTARNLRRVFRLMERLKGEGKGSDFRARRVHVIGAGVMGSDIAAWCALRGLQVTLQDRELQYIEPALARAKKLFRRKLKKPAAVAAAQTRLIADVEGRGAARADLVIEAIFEDAEVKRALFRELEPKLKPGAILASNTSAIPLEELAGALQDPTRLVGLHFFNPVAQMPLVEVVRGAQSGEAQLGAAAAFCRQIDRFPLPVQSSPGFLVNRVLAPYMLRALQMHAEGSSKEDLDAAATRFGMPMGPVELADVVGLDVGLKVIQTLGGDGAASAKLESLVAAGKLGKKSGEGMYRWKDGKPQRERQTSAATSHLDALAERLMEPFFAECRACLADGVVADADLLDAGIIFGTGFAPFRGGPLHYLESTGRGAA